MDETDLRILNVLRKAARTPFVDIARTAGVSDATVHLRVRGMLKSGVIERFSAIVNHEKLGYALTAFVEINVRPGALSKVISAVAKMKSVLEVHELHGQCDLLVKVKARDLEGLRLLVTGIKSIQDVTASHSLPVLRVVKEHPDLDI
ncbi:MAG TPA: Lrp/AsnC family transcriptional regulator [Thermoplasmata archaeon]|nr:Lrp/AsnC family transcriptional regulator [Thermoplasmata archaeon]